MRIVECNYNHEKQAQCKYCNSLIGYVAKDIDFGTVPGFYDNSPTINYSYLVCPVCDKEIILHAYTNRT